jgi:subtilisin family serine protease
MRKSLAALTIALILAPASASAQRTDGVVVVDRPAVRRAMDAARTTDRVRDPEGRQVQRDARQTRQLVLERDYQRAASGAWFRRGEIVIASADPQAPAAARRLGLELHRRDDLAAAGLILTTWRAPHAAAEDLVSELRALLPGQAVDLNYIYEFREAAQGRGRVGAGASVPSTTGLGHRTGAIIDTGSLADAAALSQVQVRSARFTEGETSPSEHASAVAVLLAGAAGPGNLTLLAADVAENGPLAGGAAASIARAANWAAGEGASVINISMTGPENAALAAVVEALTDRGVVIVAAAGNDGPRAAAPYPAALPGVVAVTAVDGRLRIWRRATQGPHVDFAAPGVDVPALGRRWTGTSVAAPIVAGMLLRGAGGPEDLAEMAQDLGVPGRDPVFGDGYLAAN